MGDDVPVTTLRNGLRVASIRRPGVPVDAVALTIRSGSADDAPRARGSAHCLEHLILSRGTGRSTAGLASEFDAFGAQPFAVTGKESTTFSAVVRTADVPSALRAIRRAIADVDFTAATLESEKRVILEEFASLRQDVERMAISVTESHVFSGTTLEHPAIGDRTDILGLTETAMREFRSAHHATSNMDVCVVGPRSHEEVVSMVSKTFGNEPGDFRQATRGRRTPAGSRLHAAGAIAGDERAHVIPVVHAYPAPGVRDSRRPAAVVLAALLGSGFESMLVTELRVKNQLVYSPRAFYTGYGAGGCFTISAPTAPHNASRVSAHFRNALEMVASSSFTTSQLEYAIRHVTYATEISQSDHRAALRGLASSTHYFGRTPRLAEIVASVNRVSRGDLASLAQRMLDADFECLPRWRDDDGDE